MIAAIRPYFTKRNVIIYVCLGLLALVTIYGAWYANYYMSGNSDDIVYPYLFSHFRLHDIVLPGQHSNILKFPLYILQAVLPYNFTSFSIVNIVLVLITVLGWAALLIWLFGKRYAPLICSAMASVLLASQVFNYSLLGTTSRNIEYLIALAFIIYVGMLLQKQEMSRAKLNLGVGLGILYALAVAGDTFFLYIIFSSLFVALIFLWLTGNQNLGQTQRLKAAVSYIIGYSFLAIIIREAVKVLGIARYFTDPAYLPHILPLNHLGSSVSVSATQALDLFGANIFGQQAAASNSLVFLNFLLLGLGLVGLICIVKDVVGTTRRLKTESGAIDTVRFFTLGVAALSFFVAYVLYIMSDQVVRGAANGTLVSAGQERYLTMLPLLLIVGISYLIWRNADERKLIVIGLPSVIVACIILNAISIKNSHNYSASLKTGPVAVAQAIRAHHIPVLISGYWYGSSVRFWSHDQVMFASTDNCNIPAPPFNTRISWYNPNPSIRSSAILVDRRGIDEIYSACPDKQLIAIYGRPKQIIHVNTTGSPVLWLYNYDVRSRLKQFTL